MKEIAILLQDGSFFKAKSFGKEGTAAGELVFNTALTGYQEIITDPSYAGQFVLFTMPEIGNTGTNKLDFESNKAHLKGIFVKNFCKEGSNFRKTGELEDLLKKQNIFGICNIDTRALTKKLRVQGAMKIIVSTQQFNPEKLQHLLDKTKDISNFNYVKEVSTNTIYEFIEGGFSFNTFTYKIPNELNKTIAVIDFGVKSNILRNFVDLKTRCLVFPSDFNVNDLIKLYESKKISGVFLSNGPGDPSNLVEEVGKIKQLIAKNIPLCGICLGHQLLSHAFGYPTYKLKFGQHGSNHPVKNEITKRVEITTQNHNYNVPKNIKEIAQITHINLFDQTIEGVKYKNYPAISVQHHPESSPGPHENKYLFKEFLALLS